MPCLKLFALILALSVSAVSQAAADQSQSAHSAANFARAGQTGANKGEQAKLGGELQTLRRELPAKKQELARLHRKWLVAKGRTPTEKEIKEFEEKRAKGEAKLEDNPFINKNPLSNPVPARVAYYKKLEEVQRDEGRIRQLETELAR
jgi:hypothetical protein